MKNFLKRAAAFARTHTYIILKVCVSLVLAITLFSFTSLIQRELMVANNHGKLTIVAGGKTTEEGTVYYQHIGRIAINGRNIQTNDVTDNGWTTYKLEVANVFYTANSKVSMTIDSPKAIKSLSFEYQKDTGHGIIQLYLDGKLLTEVDTSSSKFSTDFITILTPQHLGINLQNIFWYSLIILFLFSSVFFVTKDLYANINYRQIAKFSILAILALVSLSMAFTYFNNRDISLFNSNVRTTELLSLAFLTLFFIGISFAALRSILPAKIKNALRWPYLFVYFFPPFLAFFLVENAYSSMAFLEDSTLFHNFLILTVTYLALSWISTSFKFGGSLLLILATAFGMLNKIMIDTRSQPLLFYHLLQFKDGLNIANATSFTFDNAVLQSIFLAWMGIALLLFLPRVSYQYPKRVTELREKLPPLLQKRFVFRTLVGLSGLLTAALLLPQIYLLTAKQANIKLNYWTMQATYAKYGSPLAMASFYEDSLIDKPQGYSHQAVSDILDQYKPAETNNKTKHPNLIIIQNESQSDFANLPNLNLSADPLAFQRSLTKDASHGSLNVSVFGGGTANTEYEVLTSNALTMLSNNIFPYQQLIDGERNSFASLLGHYGYDSVAMHPQSGLNYNRSNVYPALGFSQTYFLDSEPSINELYDLKMERNFVSDQSLFQGIQKLYEDKGDKPLFSFVVTMQGHGSYNKNSYEKPITINGSFETYADESEFLSSVQSTDQAFKNLVNYFEDYDEPTLIIMYGDHQPSLSENFYQDFMPDTQDGQTGDLSAKYSTPFIVWANFDIPEQSNKTISPNFLVPYAIELTKDSSAPLPTSAYYQFLNKLQTEVPVITTWGYKTASGKYQKELKDSQLLKDYRIVEYNSAIDSNTLNQYFDNK